MNILVTGATGFLGNNLVRLLLQQNQQVRCLVRPGYDPKTLAGLDCDVLIAPMDNALTIETATAGVDAVVHSAGLIHIGWARQAESRSVNVDLTVRLATAAARRRIRFIHVSTVDTLAASRGGRLCREDDREPSKPPCAYVVSKRAAEIEVQNLDRLDWVIVHPSFMIGPFDWKPSSGQMMLAIGRRFVPLAPGGGCSVCDVRDVSAAIGKILQTRPPSNRYILAGTNLTYLRLWRAMAQVADRRGPWKRMGKSLGKLAGLSGDWISKLRRRETRVNSAAIQMGELFHYYSSALCNRRTRLQHPAAGRVA